MIKEEQLPANPYAELGELALPYEERKKSPEDTAAEAKFENFMANADEAERQAAAPGKIARLMQRVTRRQD